MTQDTFLGYGSTSGQKWGVFLGGKSVVVFDTFVSIDYRRGWAIADYPVEEGAFESYDKVQLPFDVRVKFASGGSPENRQALLNSVEAISKTLLLYSVVTPEAVYPSVNVQHIDYRRTSTNGVGMIQVEMWLLEVRITATETSATSSATPDAVSSGANDSGLLPFQGAPLTNTASPSGMSPFNNGFISPTISTVDTPLGIQ